MLQGIFWAADNAGIKNRPGILDLSLAAKPSRPPVPGIFYKAFISQAWRAGEVIGHTLKTPADFPRARMAWQLYLSSEPIPLPCYSSLFSFLLRGQFEPTVVPTCITVVFWVMPSQTGIFFFFPSWFSKFHWWQDEGQDEVKFSMKYFSSLISL